MALISPVGLSIATMAACGPTFCSSCTCATVPLMSLMLTCARSPDFHRSGGRLAAGPGKIRRREQGVVRADLDGRGFVVDGRDQALHVIAFVDRPAPVVVFVGFQRVAVVRQNIVELAAPAVAPVVGVQAVANGLVGGALHGDVERGVHAQAALMHRFRAVGAFQIFADFLHEVRRQRVSRRLRRAGPCGCAMACRACASVIFPTCAMRFQHHVAPRERALRVQDRRIAGSANQSGQQRGFRHVQLAHRFCRNNIPRRLQIRNCRGKDKSGCSTS